MVDDFGHYIPYLEISFALNLGFGLWDELLKNVQTRIKEASDTFQEEIAKDTHALSSDTIEKLNDEPKNVENGSNSSESESRTVRIARKCGFYFCGIIGICILLIPYDTSLAPIFLFATCLAPAPALVTCVAKLWHPLRELNYNKKNVQDMRGIKKFAKRMEKRHTRKSKRMVEKGTSNRL